MLTTTLSGNQIVITYQKDILFKLPPTCTIQSNHNYWNGYKWTQIETHLQMNEVSENSYIYMIQYDNTDKYMINIIDEFNGIKVDSKTIDAVNEPTTEENVDKDELAVVTNNTLKQANGDDTTLMDEDAIPLKGVTIKAIDKSDNTKQKETTSDEYGAWKLVLNHGSYIFIFSLDNYNQIVIERSI